MSEDDQAPEAEKPEEDRPDVWQQLADAREEIGQLKQELRSAMDMLDPVCRNDEGHESRVGEAPNLNLTARLLRYIMKKEKCPFIDAKQ